MTTVKAGGRGGMGEKLEGEGTNGWGYAVMGLEVPGDLNSGVVRGRRGLQVEGAAAIAAGEVYGDRISV